jgi:hypothetical protein
MNGGEARRFACEFGFGDGIEGCRAIMVANILQTDQQSFALRGINRMRKRRPTFVALPHVAPCYPP